MCFLTLQASCTTNIFHHGKWSTKTSTKRVFKRKNVSEKTGAMAIQVGLSSRQCSFSFTVIREAISDPMGKSQQWLTHPICQILPLVTFQFQKIKHFTTGIHFNNTEYIKRHMTQNLNSNPQREFPLGARHIFHTVQW